MNVSIKSYIAFAFLAVSISSYALNEDIKLTVKGYHNEHTRILDNNSVLFSGDSFRLKVEALSDLYIYAFLIDSNNNVQQLQSQNSNSFITKDQSISFPSSNTKDWYRLVGNTGIETLIIISSPNKLNTAQITNADQLNLLETSKVTLEKFIIKHLSAKLAMRGLEGIKSIDEGLSSPIEISSNMINNLMPVLENSSQAKTIIKIMEDSKETEFDNSSTTRGVKEVRIFKDSAPAVVYIVNPTGHGTGVIISNDGLIFTNSHVVGDSKKVAVYFKPKNSGKYSSEDYIAGMVVNRNKSVDLALIKLVKNPVGIKPLTLAEASSIEIGQDVHAIGHPGDNAQWTYTRGLIGQIIKNHEWGYGDGIKRKAKMVIQSQTPIYGGNSGGPLLNDSGKVIGVNTFSGDYAGANYAVSVKDLKLFLNEKFTIPKAPAKTTKTINASKYWEGNVIKVIRSDYDKDGVLDTLFYLDDDKTGIWETLLIEIGSSNELIVIYDWDEDGGWNEKIINTNSNPRPDFHIFDRDGDGKADYFGYDDNDNGQIDRYEDA